MTIETQPPSSKFAYVVVAARRARQLMIGAPILIDNSRAHKFTRIALEELDAGRLEFELTELPPGPEDKEGKRRSG